LVVADTHEAVAVAEADRLAKRWPALLGADLDERKVKRLWAVLGAALGAGVMRTPPALRLLHQAPNGGPRVYAVPSPLIERVVALDDGTLEAAAGAWAQAEEFVRDDWSPVDARALLWDMRVVCQRATAFGRGLLLRLDE